MTEIQRRAIVQHGERLLAIFPNATERDPVALCKKLRRLEVQGHILAVRLCSGPEYPGGYEEAERLAEAIISKADTLLGNQHADRVPVFLNRDARGYALKIAEAWVHAHPQTRIAEDWGGYGIIAPEFNRNGN
jgi:hypothetical protein